MPDRDGKDVVTFAVTIDKTRVRVDKENSFVVKHVPEMLKRAEGLVQHFYFSRRWSEKDEPRGDSIWLRFKAREGMLDELRERLQVYLKIFEADDLVEKVWDPKVESDQDVFGTAPGFEPGRAYGSLWCFVDATSRTAVNLLTLSEGGRLDVPEWVIADIWIHYFYNALGVPDFVRCPVCKSDQALRLPRCHACGFVLKPSESNKERE